MVIKIKYWIDNSRKNQIIKAISIINGLQNYYFLMLESSDNDVVNETYVDWDVFSKLYSIKNDEYVIFITEKPFVDNWFSHE